MALALGGDVTGRSEELSQLRHENRLLRERVAELERGASRFGAHANPALPSAALSEREALLIEAERIIHMGSWVWDVVASQVFWSDELFRILGYDAERDAPTTENFFAAVHPEDLPRVRMHSQNLVATGVAAHVDCRVRWRDGMMRYVSMSGASLFDDQGVLQRVVGTVLDVTEARLAARETERALSLLAEAQRIAQLGSWVFELSTGRLEWSAQMLRILGLPPGTEPSAELVLNALHPEDRQRMVDTHTRALATGSGDGEARVVRPDGKIRHVYVVGTPLLDAEGKLVELRGTLLDITHRVELEQQLLSAQKLEALGRLSGGIAHDFNNLLTVMLGNLDLLKREVTGKPLAFVQQIVQASELAAQLTRQLLSFARRAPLAPRVISLRDVLPEVLDITRRLLPSAISLESELDEALWRVRVDAAQLQQILMNLVMNARDAMPGGGRIVVRASNQHIERDGVGSATLVPGPYVMLSVRDNGVGMDEATRVHIFEPFFTTKPAGKGSGLGLAVVFGAVAQQAGVICVDSEPGQGTCFRIYFPRVDAPDIGPLPSHRPALPATQQSRILIVEDEATVALVMQQALEAAGYQVQVAALPSQALSLFGQSQGRFDLVICDVMMPELRGPQLVAELARIAPLPRVLFVTGYGPELFGDAAQRREHPVLEKPFRAEALLAKVAQLLEKQ